MPDDERPPLRDRNWFFHHLLNGSRDEYERGAPAPAGTTSPGPLDQAAERSRVAHPESHAASLRGGIKSRKKAPKVQERKRAAG